MKKKIITTQKYKLTGQIVLSTSTENIEKCKQSYNSISTCNHTHCDEYETMNPNLKRF